MTVRTAQLGSGNPAGGSGWNVIYTCPAGRTTILKDVRVLNNGPTVSTFAVEVRRPVGSGLPGPVGVTVLTGSLAANGLAAVTEGFIVLEPGDQIRMIVVEPANTTTNVWTSGAILSGTSPDT